MLRLRRSLALLGLPKQVPDISPTQYDIRNILKGARALNNNEPFPGERLLHRLLDKTYYAHVLPPLPEKEEGVVRAHADAELSHFLGRGSEAISAVSGWIDGIREGLKKRL